MMDGERQLPIEHLLERKPFPEKLAMIKLIAEADAEAISFSSSDAERPHYNVLYTLCSKGSVEDLLQVADILLALHPKAASLPDGRFQSFPIHGICERVEDEAFPVAEKLIALYPESLRVLNYFGRLPVYTAAEYSTLKLVKLLLRHCPESLNIRPNGSTLMHYAASNSSPSAEEIIRYIFNLHPTLVTVKGSSDNLPIFCACSDGAFIALKVLYELYPLGIREVDSSGDLPIHDLIRNDYHGKMDNENDPRVDMLRFLLRHYPESALVPVPTIDSDDDEEAVPRTRNLYDTAVRYEKADHVRRLILRAAPSCDPPELHRLNYAARRMALFLAFAAVTSDSPPNSMVHTLRGLTAGYGTDMPLLKHVISFL
jgi:hypothetical protein